MTIVLKDVGSGFKRTAINENFETLEATLNNDVFLVDGSQPLTSEMDANSNRIINLADGLAQSDAVTLRQLEAGVGGGAGVTDTADMTHTADGGVEGNLKLFLDSQDNRVDSVVATVLERVAYFDNVTDMIAGTTATTTITHVIGNVYSTGGTTFRVDSVSDPVVIGDFTALSDVNVAAFGALQDNLDISVAMQAAVDYAGPRRIPVKLDGNYRIGATINMRNRSTINAFGSVITVDTGIGILFNVASNTAGGVVNDVTIEGGEWKEDVAGGDRTLANVTFYHAEGEWIPDLSEPYAHSIVFSYRTFINRVYVHSFNYFMVSNWHRTWNVTNSFMVNRNAFRIEHKNVETTISNCLIFGTDTLATDTVGIDVGVGIVVGPADAFEYAGMYPEGFKVHNCTIDQFYVGILTHEVLDMNVYDCWIAAGTTDANLRWAVKFEINATGNNFLSGVHFHNNTYARSKIEFVGHSGAPTQAFIQMTDSIYISAQTILVGLRWYGVEFDKWTLNSVSPKLGFNCADENKYCRFTNLNFKGSWSSLFDIGTISSGLVIDNCWSDSFIDDPYSSQTRIQITNSAGGKPEDGATSKHGQILWTASAASAVEGNYLVGTPNMTFKPGALLVFELHGIINNTSASGIVEVKVLAGGAAVVESASAGVSWDSKFIEINNAQVRVDASYIFRCTGEGTTSIGLLSLTGDSTVSTHTYATLRYL